MQGREGNRQGSWIGRALRAVMGRARPRGPEYQYQPEVAALSYEEACARLEARGGHRIVRYGIDSYNEGTVGEVERGLAQRGIPMERYRIDPERFAEYERRAEYEVRYPDYYGVRMAEKHLEHFLALELLALGPSDVFIDLASEDSPVPDIFERLTGAKTYWQDIQYPAGIHGRRIGGDACAMPLPDGFATAAALTCSIEHFEQEADALVCREVARVLRPGGRFIVAPLYMNSEAAVQTDPVYSAQADVPFDEGVAIQCQKDWRNRHGRFYSPESLDSRLLAALRESFDVVVKRIENHEAIEGHVYLRFALFCRRK
jgi:SAM-dependent methyltransferase